jgi:polysaccharide biosynthesis/export protein
MTSYFRACHRSLWAACFLLSVPKPFFAQTSPAETTVPSVRSQMSSVVLGPGDQVTVAAPEIEELDRRQLKVQSDGTVSVPLVGPMKVTGLTPQQFAEQLTKALQTQFKDPKISFTQIDVRSKPVTVLGAVNQPGVVQADGRKRLIEILSQAGGLRPDAGPTLTLARKSGQPSAFPAEVKTSVNGNNLTAVIPISGLMEGTDPASNVLVQSGDIITVPKGKLVYVLGDVKRAGGFPLGEANDLTVLKALSLAQGLRDTAKPNEARILRDDADGHRSEVPLDLKKLLEGKLPDVAMRANDVLYVPSSTSKKVASRTLDALIQTGTGIAIYGK